MVAVLEMEKNVPQNFKGKIYKSILEGSNIFFFDGHIGIMKFSR